MNELKPCPCCGSTARPVGSRSGINPHWKLCRVICDRCGLTTANHSTPEEAAAAWNTRATPPRAEVDVERVVRAIRLHLSGLGYTNDELFADVECAMREALDRATGGSEAQGEPTLEEIVTHYDWVFSHSTADGSREKCKEALAAVRTLCLSRAPSPSPALGAKETK